MKRLQVVLKNESWIKLDAILSQCNDGFSEGAVRTQDVIDWILINTVVDVQKLRLRCLNPNKIKANARLDSKQDVEELMKKLLLIKPLLKDRDEK